MKNIVIFGGGTGLSRLLKGIKDLPFNLTIVVTISDNGGSTGTIRDLYDIPAPGDLRRVVVALSTNEELEELMNYRFDDKLQNHTVGNLILVALTDIKGNMQSAVSSYSKLLDVEQEILPISNESLVLGAKMKNGCEVFGETQICKYPAKIDSLFYSGNPSVNATVLERIKTADAIIFSSGSLYSSIISNLIFEDLANGISKSNAKKIYVANLMTERGETEEYKLSDHINAIDNHLVHSRIDYVIANDNFDVPKEILDNYNKECASLVEIDEKNIDAVIIRENLIRLNVNNYIRHNTIEIGTEITKILNKEYDEK
ncbi:MAG: gluconeogenesis factor YvcK family protein [Mycoplasmatales bacterium]